MDLMDRRRFLKRIMAQGVSSVETGGFAVSEDIRASQYPIAHHFGSAPDFVLVVADEFTALASDTNAYIANAYCAKANLIASGKNNNGFAAYQFTWLGRDSSRALTEDVAYTKFLKDSTFYVPYYSVGDCLKAGVTYHYIVGKFE